MRSLRPIREPCSIGVAKILMALAFLTALTATTRAATDSSWPRQFDSSSGTFLIYEPQPEALNGDLLSARAAFSLQKAGESNPTYGVLWFTEQIVIDRDSSTVAARNLDVTKVRMPAITPAEASKYERLVETEATRWDLSGSLDELQAGLASTEKERASVAGLDNTPPRILFAYERSILVVFDGAPLLEPIDGSNLERVSNTPYAIVHEPPTGYYYLNGANLWYRAKNPLGPWTEFSDPPTSVRMVMPPDTSAVDQIDGPPPRVLTAMVPTELIAIDGKPQYAPLVGDELIYVTNTESDVVREVSTQMLYVLIAGRWYRAPSDQGPWAYVRGDGLPASFKQVPADSPKGNVLASVAGTEQADDAVADSEIPQTSAIRRDLTGFVVNYDGHPQFVNIGGTSLQYAINSDVEVIFADGYYFACDQGVWYISEHEDGPWAVSEVRPVGLDDIPPSCPVYHTRYVYIYDTTPDVIYVGYLPGYIGCYPYHGTVVYGTGYRYRAWRGHRHYYPRPYTWGFHPRYNPYLSRWSFGFSYWAGFLHVGFRWHSGQLAAHRNVVPLWFGPGGYRRPLLGSDKAMLRTRLVRRAPVGAQDRLPMNLYSRSWNANRVNRVANRVPLRRYMRPLAPAPGVPNNVYAGKDGKVYRRDNVGNWKVYERPTWKPARVPTVQPGAQKRIGRRAERAPGSRWDGPITRTPPQPAPMTLPARPETPRFERPPQPEPPPISTSPGDLEREFRGRQRSSDGGRGNGEPGRSAPPASSPAPTPAPTVKPEPQPAPQPEPQWPPKRTPAPKPTPQQIPPNSKP